MTMTLERPTTRPDVVQQSTRAAVDELYAGDTVAAFRAIETATADPTENVREWELTHQQRQVYEAGYMVGFQMAAPELLAEILELRGRLEQAGHDADRYYAEMCRRPAPAEHTATEKSYAELSRIRGDHDRAARQDAAIDRMFPQYASARA
jgi:ATP/maltotriose-dependent transcriptional regulator MalT